MKSAGATLSRRDRRPDTRNRVRIRLKIGLFVLVLAIVCYFVGRSIWEQWGVIRAYSWQPHFWWLICSAAVMWLDFLLIIRLWRVLLVTVTGRQLRFGAALRITALSNLGKYVPGKIWSVMGIIYMLRQRGYPAPAALSSTILHQAFTIIAGAAFIIAVLGHELFKGALTVPLTLVCALCIAVLYPPIFSRILNWGLRLIKREPVTFQLTFGKAVGLFGAYVVAWIVYGISFWCLLKGIGIQPPAFWETVASFGGAYLLGFLALFAPGGLGVREGILAMLLAPQLSPGLAAFVAVISRFWMTILELTQLIPLAFGWGRPPAGDDSVAPLSPRKPSKTI